MVPLSKSGVRKHRGFESRPLRHPRCSRTGRAFRPVPPSSGRGRLVDYGAALEMRFGATRRGFESRPLRHTRSALGSADAGVGASAPRPGTSRGARSGARTPPWPRPPAGRADVACQRSTRALAPGVLAHAPWDHHHRRQSGVSSLSRARRGTSGALYLQSAPAGLNPLPRSPLSNAARRRDVEDRVPRSGEPRTVSGPEGSSTKRSSPSAAERPDPSRSSWWARKRSGRRRVHGTSSPSALARRRS